MTVIDAPVTEHALRSVNDTLQRLMLLNEHAALRALKADWYFSTGSHMSTDHKLSIRQREIERLLWPERENR